MNSKNIMLIKTLERFFDNKNLITLRSILEKKSKISLRVIDWFVTNYCKKFNVIYQIKKKNNTEYFNVYFDYKNQLKAYQKKLFDPFKRKNKNNTNLINFNGIQTTIGQLNFFKWAIKKKIIQYIKDHLNNIEDDMNKSTKLRKTTKNKLSSISATRTISKQYVEHIVTFD